MNKVQMYLTFFMLFAGITGCVETSSAGNQDTTGGDRYTREIYAPDSKTDEDTPSDTFIHTDTSETETIEIYTPETTVLDTIDTIDSYDSYEYADRLDNLEQDLDETAADPIQNDISEEEDVSDDAGNINEIIKCSAYEDCPENMVCNFALGRCEERASQKAFKQARIFSFHPLKVAKNDILVIDGQGFYTSIWGGLSVRVFIGGKGVGKLNYGVDENRIAVLVPDGANGPVRVISDSGISITSKESVGIAPSGVIQCTGDTPQASGVMGSSPTSSGPYAAGYLDLTKDMLRLFYPAECGSVRRPAKKGTYPLIILLHGNGAGLINYEYLGQLLATWGFITVMPATDHTNEYDPDVVKRIFSIYQKFADTDLSNIHPALSGLHTSDAVGFIGHSRGCGRIDELFRDHGSELAPHTKAVVFLGPVGVFSSFPGYELIFGATQDGQSHPLDYNTAYRKAKSPKWKIIIKGGNHSLFCDAKVYYSFDGNPTITRHQQHSIVRKYTLPILQRAFGLEEPFASIIDNPQQDPLVQIESQ